MNTTVDIYEKYKKQIDELTNVNPELGNFYKSEFLKKEAKRRGFKKGVKFKCLISAEVGVLIEDYFLYNGSFGRGNSLESAFKNSIINGVLFKEGQWAEIIDDKAELKELREKL